MPMTYFLGDSTRASMKVINFTIPSIALWLTALGLEVDAQYLMLVGGSSIAGSLMLGYFKPEKTFFAQLNQMIMATIGGLILGSAFVEWRQYQNPAYISLSYCICSMLVLIFLRTIVRLFEANAGKFTTTLIQRIFNVKLDEVDTEFHKTKGGGRRRVNRLDNDIRVEKKDHLPPTVIIGPSAKPDEIRVIEQTEVETKKEGEL